MKVLFAVSNDKMSESIVRQYQKEFKQIISYKNVYYFNAILKELQRDKSYDRIVISEDLEQYVNTDYEQMDKFLFDKLDSISDEASNMNGEDIPIILICTERRNKAASILIKLFGIGIYNAIIGNDRSVNEVCRLINRPRSKKEAKIYYKIDAEDVSYEKDVENEVSELEIQNILAHYKRIGNDEARYIESFDSIASQYNDAQLRIISKFLPLNVRAVLEEKSPKYQQVNSYNNKISDNIRVNNNKKQEQAGTSEMFLKNTATTNFNEPVVVPSSIDASKKRKILTKPKMEKENILQDIEEPKQDAIETNTLSNMEDMSELDELLHFNEIPEIEEETFLSELPGIDELTGVKDISEFIIDEEDEIEKKVEEQPLKRGRGRPPKPKIEVEEQAQTPKRGRGRPPKPKTEVEEPVKISKRGRGRPPKQKIEVDEIILPGIEEQNEENILPGFSTEEDSILPGVTYQGSEDQMIFSKEYEDDSEEDAILPGFNNEEDVEDEYTNILQNLKKENEIDAFKIDESIEQVMKYPELDIENLLDLTQKLVAFVGTSKNGTSFLVNNVAELLSANGIDTAILDLTHNRNAYYIYTKNEEELREQSNSIMSNLKMGRATGLKEHKNLTVYTTAFENDEEIQNVEPIIETLVKNHTVVLMDCDFTTPMKYFKYSQEIYLVQSMDILTIQPLTAFLRQLSDKKMFDESKVRVILNKFIKTREINEELLIGGISIYNDAGMTVRKELFNRRTVRYLTVPFELKTYLRYLEGLVTCDVSLKGYSKEFMQSLKKLASMIYQGANGKNEKYMPPSVKNNSGFSANMDKTLNRMKQNY